MHLKTPKGELRSEAFRMGRILYQPGETTRLVVDVARTPRPLRLTKPQGKFTVIVNDKDVTDRIEPADDGWLEVALPGNDQPHAVHAQLDVQVQPQLGQLAATGRGGLVATVHNAGNVTAREVVAVPFIEGFVRHYGHPARIIPTLGANTSARVSWGLTGTAQGTTGQMRVAAGADNARVVVAPDEQQP